MPLFFGRARLKISSRSWRRQNEIAQQDQSPSEIVADDLTFVAHKPRCGHAHACGLRRHGLSDLGTHRVHARQQQRRKAQQLADEPQNAFGARRATYAWCLFGIADLVVAITMGAMTSPGRPHLLAFEAPNLLVTAYPLVMVPTFAVPLALMLHGLVLWRLRRETASTGRLVAA